MEPTMIESVRIRGFRSLKDIELSEIPRAAVLIGANGSGKSNFIRFFEMMNCMLEYRRLAEFIGRQGGADDQLHGGSRHTSRIEAEVRLRTDEGCGDYRFMLSRAQPDRFIFAEEAFRFVHSKDSSPATNWYYLGSGHSEAKIVEAVQLASASAYSIPLTPASLAWLEANPLIAERIFRQLRRYRIYQFHDTSDESNFKKRWDAEDNNDLLNHGGNLAAMLLRLEREDIKRYERICQHIGRILPLFDRFQIEESYGKVLLRWKAKWTDKTFGAHLTSDGSLRFFALVTLLNLPPEMLPDVLLLDEPELGLHPAAIALVGGMIKSLAEERQVIVATQSPLLVDAFGLDEVFVLELQEGRTEFRKLAPNDYQVWLDDNFTSGELWQKNLLGGRP